MTNCFPFWWSYLLNLHIYFFLNRQNLCKNIYNNKQCRNIFQGIASQVIKIVSRPSLRSSHDHYNNTTLFQVQQHITTLHVPQLSACACICVDLCVCQSMSAWNQNRLCSTSKATGSPGSEKESFLFLVWTTVQLYWTAFHRPPRPVGRCSIWVPIWQQLDKVQTFPYLQMCMPGRYLAALWSPVYVCASNQKSNPLHQRCLKRKHAAAEVHRRKEGVPLCTQALNETIICHRIFIISP